MSPGEVTLEGLLDMSEEQVCELLQKFGANEEECARLNASLSCLRKAHQLGRNAETTSPTNRHVHRNKQGINHHDFQHYLGIHYFIYYK